MTIEPPEYSPHELSYFEPIRGLSTNQCLRIAVEAVKFATSLHPNTTYRAHMETHYPELMRLCAEAKRVSTSYEEA